MWQAVNELKEDLKYLCTSQWILREDIETLQSLQSQTDEQLNSRRTHVTEYKAVSSVIKQIKLQQLIIEDGTQFLWLLYQQR